MPYCNNHRGVGFKHFPLFRLCLAMSRDVKLSKTLSWILRHGANQVNVNMDNEGFAFVDELLSLQQLRGHTVEDVQRVVVTNEKQRFSLKTGNNENTNRLMIKANQGHSLVVERLELKEVLSATDFPIVVHGSYYKNWDSIKTKGLSRMTRQHIHFATDVSHGNVISGMRNNCDLLIYVDLEKALKDDHKFYVSPNGVVLCSGNKDGYLPFVYFKECYRLVNGERVLLELQ